MAQKSAKRKEPKQTVIPPGQSDAEVTRNLRSDPLFLEMQEEMSRDNLIRFFKNNGNALFTLLLVLLITIGGYKTWEHFHNQNAEEAGLQLFEAVANPQSADTTKKLQEAARFGAYTDMAKMNEAQFALRNGDSETAVKLYDEVAKDKGAKPAFRDLSALNAANILLNNDPSDAGIETRLKALTENSTYKYSARELLAVYYIQNNRPDQARTLLEELSANPETPITISGRAKQILTTI